MDNKAEIRIKEREAAIKAWLKELEEVKGAKLPVSPERIYEALENIDVAKALKEFTSDEIDLQDFINENAAQAVIYEWYYDGNQVKNIFTEEGYACESCLFDDESCIDVLELPDSPGFERDPEFEDYCDDTLYCFCIDSVMNVWYEELSPEFSNKSDEYIDLNSKLGVKVDLNNIKFAYDELFHLKLVSLIREAHLKAFEENPIQITTGKPFHMFIQRHERWPMHILSLNI